MGNMVGRSKRLYLGTDVETDTPVNLWRQWLETHLHVLGPPDAGKTRFLFWLFQQLVRDPYATVIVLNPKGDFCGMARDWAITQGLSRRLVLLDPRDPEVVCGYNPLRPNGLPTSTQAKALRESFRAAWGQSSFEGTPQLARILFLVLYAACELQLNLVEAVEILHPASLVRRQVLRCLQDEQARRALEYFDSLREARQDELAASTLARLEAFVIDPSIRRLLTAPESLDLGTVISERQILLVNLEINRPLRIDDVRLLGKFLVNDIVAHVFGRSGPRHPVYLILDEVHVFATEDLSHALALGRELGLHCILAHQDLDQLREEDNRGHLLSSVKACARTKIVFGGLTVEAMEPLVKELFIDQFDPYTIKDELTSLEQEMVEEEREVVARAVTWSEGNGWNLAATTGQSRDWRDGRSETEGGAEGRHWDSGVSTSTTEQASDGEATLPTGEVVETSTAGDATTTTEAMSEGGSSQRNWQHARTHQTGGGRSKQLQSGRSGSSQRGGTITRTLTPFQAVRKRRNVSSRTFLSLEEFLVGCLQRTRAQTKGHCVIKVPTAPAVFLRLPYVKTPWISRAALAQARERIFSRPFYTRLVEGEPARRPQVEVLAPAPRYLITEKAHAAKVVRYKRNKGNSET